METPSRRAFLCRSGQTSEAGLALGAAQSGPPDPQKPWEKRLTEPAASSASLPAPQPSELSKSSLKHLLSCRPWQGQGPEGGRASPPAAYTAALVPEAMVPARRSARERASWRGTQLFLEDKTTSLHLLPRYLLPGMVSWGCCGHHPDKIKIKGVVQVAERDSRTFLSAVLS